MLGSAGSVRRCRGAALALAGSLPFLLAPGGAAGESIDDSYRHWAARHEARGGDRNVVLRLGWSKAYSRRFSSASGTATLDLLGGALRVEVEGREGGDVWLVDNSAAGSAAPGPDDGMLLVGPLERRGARGVLSAALDELPPGFEVDLLAVTQPGATPEEGGVLFGTPGLWQRRYTQERLARRGGHPPRQPRPPTLEELVQRGEALFFEETFGGNGRTCGTCHPAENNFTIDPVFIATLAPDDPLFVAEFVPALARNFEKPALLRGLALILENTNGFENPESNFTMRSVPHTLALRTSITPEEGFPAENATGWSGDGAPSGGSLRQFANGAIRQHFPKSTQRVEGADFRFASEAELDAMEAFQLSLGRTLDPNVTPGSPGELVFRSPLAERGKQLFSDSDSSDGNAGKCQSCHANAGATSLSSGTNDNFNTGVEDIPDAPADRIVAEVGDPNLADNPPDDGLGHPGDGTFNTPPLVEAADSAPFFHNNAAATLEEAIDFYNSDAFAQSPSGRFLSSPNSGELNGVAIALDGESVAAVAAFLRVLNVLENVRSAEQGVDAALAARHSGSYAEALERAAADVADAARVLSEGALHPDADRQLRAARALLQRATRGRHASGGPLANALGHLRVARSLVVAEAAEPAGDGRCGPAGSSRRGRDCARRSDSRR
jgi:cytochrome c peroxidase